MTKSRKKETAAKHNGLPATESRGVLHQITEAKHNALPTMENRGVHNYLHDNAVTSPTSHLAVI